MTFGGSLVRVRFRDLFLRITPRKPHPFQRRLPKACQRRQGKAETDMAMTDVATAMMHASVFGHVDVVRLLLEAGADKNATMKDGETVLFT